MATFDISSDDTSDESDSHHDGPSGRNALIDLEAAEASDEDGYEGEQSELNSKYSTFHPFGSLPPELRRRVWDFFYPDITLKARCLAFDLSPAPIFLRLDSRHPEAETLCPTDGISLEFETLPLRRMLAVHQESRSIALKSAPDALNLNAIGSGDAIIRFNKQKDVVMVQSFLLKHPRDTYLLSEFAKDITQLAIFWFPGSLDPKIDELVDRLQDFPNLERIFFCEDGRGRKAREIAWCGSDLIHRYSQIMFEKEPGLGEDAEWVICWPDIDRHVAFAKYEIGKMYPLNVPRRCLDKIRDAGMESWPMLYFDDDSAMRRYNRAMSWAGIPYEEGASGSDSSLSGSDGEDDGGTDQDEYESDGIDDSEIVEGEDVSEDEEVPAAISVGSSPVGGADLQAHFSSQEPEDDEPTAGSDTGIASAMEGRRKKRRIVSDSDDDSVVEEPRAKRARMTRAVMIDSDDDEGGVEQAGPSQGSHIVISDSDSSDTEPQTSKSKTRKTNGRVEDSESSSEDESDDVKETRHITLGERLQRQLGPQVISSDEDSGDEEDAVEISDDDDEEGNSEDDEDGLIDGMAAESDGEGDGSDDEGW